MVKLYENVLYPINGMENWTKISEVAFELEPPRTKKQRGRPRKKRTELPVVMIQADGVQRLQRHVVAKCGRCGGTGHNKRTCTNDLINPSSVRLPQNENQSQPQSHPQAQTSSQASQTRGPFPPPVSIPRKPRSKAQRCGRRGNKD
ncbi:hypothetical protein AAHA92_09851 [Salvia divinorum]|uniref:CCHC-type domain-containing protein n=1 Tax=Salvia divinorum TaxID=28513 RepID=A0ABD1HSR8_SALDI